MCAVHFHNGERLLAGLAFPVSTCFVLFTAPVDELFWGPPVPRPPSIRLPRPSLVVITSVPAESSDICDTDGADLLVVKTEDELRENEVVGKPTVEAISGVTMPLDDDSTILLLAAIA